MGHQIWVPCHCPPPGPCVLLLLLLLLASGGAQHQAGGNHPEPPEFNTTAPAGPPTTSVSPAFPGTKVASQSPAPGSAQSLGAGLTPTPGGTISGSTEGLVLTEDGQPCRFPFRYGGRVHRACTSEGGARRKWCATTHNYDRDRAWGYCAPPATTPPGAPGPLDPCASRPCLNGGSCFSAQDTTSYLCSCPVAFTGQDCSQEKCFDETRLEYLEDGERWAHVRQGRVEQCVCAKGQVRCSDAWHTACVSSPCLNGGTCHLVEATGTTVCTCPPGFAGRLCNTVPAQRCFQGNGTEYRGLASTTASGLSCLAWNSDLLFQELHVDSVSAAAFLGLGPHAYCRNPDKDERPWCYAIKDSVLSWEYCNLVACGSEKKRMPVRTAGPAACVQGWGARNPVQEPAPLQPWGAAGPTGAPRGCAQDLWPEAQEEDFPAAPNHRGLGRPAWVPPLAGCSLHRGQLLCRQPHPLVLGGVCCPLLLQQPPEGERVGGPGPALLQPHDGRDADVRHREVHPVSPLLRVQPQRPRPGPGAPEEERGPLRCPLTVRATHLPARARQPFPCWTQVPDCRLGPHG
ncbi:hepatocyte growth factor activator isoform X4 [Echinops telfairi]|uniref:Hepatocyte growth factor activator isoform X4 n=1 Tax=Echinops telfairi TaxID=9371 RepID=A0AC55D108_ECHTE|nr:hepatocyte growth factor activator isoform X4 [Echinops telfairi]